MQEIKKARGRTKCMNTPKDVPWLGSMDGTVSEVRGVVRGLALRLQALAEPVAPPPPPNPPSIIATYVCEVVHLQEGICNLSGLGGMGHHSTLHHSQTFVQDGRVEHCEHLSPVGTVRP
eukprot:Sspe_Gene.50037::Locus_27507_Transcript_1_1_Confidence_1.000_Length_949::g.50037::m.50037